MVSRRKGSIGTSLTELLISNWAAVVDPEASRSGDLSWWGFPRRRRYLRSADEAATTLVAVVRDDGFEVSTHGDRILERLPISG